MSLNAGASAQVLLAWLPDNDLRGLIGRAVLTRFTDVSYGEVDTDTVGIAAPVFGRPDEVVARLSVVLLRSRVTEEQIRTIADTIVETARRLSHEVGLLAR